MSQSSILPSKVMNVLLALSLLAASACITLASVHWGHGYGDFGHDHHGHDHDHSYDKGYTKGFDRDGYGEYGSHKYGGWKSYAKGEEHGSHYGSEYGEDHGHGGHGGEYHGHGFEYDHYPFHHDHHGDLHFFKKPFGRHEGYEHYP